MFKYTIDLPYPSIKDLNVNIEYGQYILSNLSGLHSKMNTITLYFYNSIILQDSHPQLKSIMEEICKVELIHLKIFADMCFYLGVDPRLWECKNDMLEYWSPGYVIYNKQVIPMIENAIFNEQNAICNYSHQIDIIKNEKICNMLRRIILDEQLHVEILQSLLKEYIEKTDEQSV